MKTLLTFIIVIGCLFIMSGCGSLPKDWTGISEEDVKLWSEGGFTSVEAQEWRAKGFPPGLASEWKSAGFNLDLAVPWQKEGFDAVEAKAWKNIDFSLNKAMKYRERGMMPRSLRSPASNPEVEKMAPQTENPAGNE